MHAQRTVTVVIDAEHNHRWQSDKQFADTRRVHFHRGSPGLDDLRQPSSSQGPCAPLGMLYTPLISEAPVTRNRGSASPKDKAGIRLSIR